MSARVLPVVISFLAALVAAAEQIPEVITVEPKISTQPVNYRADDAAIWSHPTDPTKSLLIGTDIGTYPDGGIFVWNLDGSQQQRIVVSHPKHIDVRYGLQLGGQPVDIAVVAMRDHNEIRVFMIDPESRTLENVTTSNGINIFFQPFGLGLYKRPSDGAIFAFVNSHYPDSKAGILQIRLEDDGTGRVKGTEVRKVGLNKTLADGIVIDDALGYLYFAEEDSGIHKHYADPERGDARLAFFARDDGIINNRSGLALYSCGDSTGYLLVANPGSQSIKAYRREGDDGNPHRHGLVTTIKNVQGEFGAGLDATSTATNAVFPKGFLIWQNKFTNQFQLYAWEDIAQDFLKACQNSGPTAVEMGLLEAESQNGYVALNWYALANPDLLGFEIQRRPANSEYQTIGYVSLERGSETRHFTYIDRDINSGDFYYRLKLIFSSGLAEFSNETQVSVPIPSMIALRQNYPNPFNPETVIRFQLSGRRRVKLTVFNLRGEEVKILVDDVLEPGYHKTRWDGRDFDGRPAASGMYFYKLNTEDYLAVRRMVLLR